MILKRLAEYADRDSVSSPPAMYASTPIRWFIVLNNQGDVTGWVSSQGEGKRGLRGEDRTAPTLTRAAGISPILLADNGEYVLGIARDPAKAERTASAHKAFVEVVNQCAEKTQLPEILAVKEFLSRWNPDEPSGLPDQFDSGDKISFRINETYPIDLPEVREFWSDYTNTSTTRHQCLTCGKVRPVEERIPGKLKGIPGGQSVGTALISANANAFESYGLTASLIAPTCRDCAEKFGNAANALLASKDHCIRIGPLAYIFWTQDDVGFNPISFLSQPNSGEVKKLITSAKTGQDHLEVDNHGFYATAFSASGGRAVVRDYIETTIEKVKGNLQRWFTMQQLVDNIGAEGEPYSIYGMASSLYRDNKDVNKNMVANVPGALLRSALYGSPLPQWLLFQAVQRNRADQGITRPRAVLIKMVLTSVGYFKEGEMVCLDSGNTNPAYLCGRLLAELEEIQRRAIPGIKATIIDRYFGTASSAPATVFGSLLSGAQNHLAKMRKEQPGSYIGFQRRLEEIMSGLHGFPKTLNLKDQALFSLGYYHQKAQDRADAIAGKERKNQSQEGNNNE